jgi:hypothetical protein
MYIVYLDTTLNLLIGSAFSGVTNEFYKINLLFISNSSFKDIIGLTNLPYTYTYNCLRGNKNEKSTRGYDTNWEDIILVWALPLPNIQTQSIYQTEV